jgi:metal-responsive CopG/Arc/MetJ family transcriptional regulator
VGRSAKVTISLPSDLLDEIEQERMERHQTRSEFVRGLVEETFRGRREQHNRARYLRGYEQCPESDEEVAEAARVGHQVLAAEPWE